MTEEHRVRGYLRSIVHVVLAAGLVLGVLAAQPAAAQNRLPRRGGPAAADGVSPGEIQRLFDAYVLMQAQQELQLSDEQLPKFLTSVKALQAARQRGLAQRARALQELRRLDGERTLDESRVQAQLKALADLEERTLAETREALAAIDQVLDLHQRIRFRLFEEQMERRKIELLMRARQASRQRNAP